MFSDCVKGYYKRAKAHAAVWNEKEARRDFNMVASLDATLASLVGRELRALSERMKEKYWEEKEAYWNMLEKTQDKEEEEEDQGSGGDGTKEQGGEENLEISEGGELSPGATGDHVEACSATISPSAPSGSEGKDWQQMLRLIMLLQDEGNFLIKEKRFQEASAKFTEALEYVDALQKLVSAPPPPHDRSSKSTAIWRVALVLLSAGQIPNCSPAKLEECQQLLTARSQLLRCDDWNKDCRSRAAIISHCCRSSKEQLWYRRYAGEKKSRDKTIRKYQLPADFSALFDCDLSRNHHHSAPSSLKKKNP